MSVDDSWCGVSGCQQVSEGAYWCVRVTIGV